MTTRRIRMKIVERTWHILLAATFLTAVWTATTLAADDRPNTAVAQPAGPATTAVAAPSKLVPTRTRLAKPARKSPRPQRELLRLASHQNCPGPQWYFSSYCGGNILLILGVGF